MQDKELFSLKLFIRIFQETTDEVQSLIRETKIFRSTKDRILDLNFTLLSSPLNIKSLTFFFIFLVFVFGILSY